MIPMIPIFLCLLLTALVEGNPNRAGQPLPQPPTISSIDGLLQTTLVVKPSFIESGPFTFQRRSYNGLPVGPTLRVKRGDKVLLTLINALGDEPETAIGQHYTNAIAKNFTGDWLHDREVYSRPNHTNIHLHGLHVSPQGDHDNIFRNIAPLSNATYEYDIPLNHPTGTFWYVAVLLILKGPLMRACVYVATHPKDLVLFLCSCSFF